MAGHTGWNEIIKGHNEDAIDAAFLSNHDMPRSALAFSGDKTKEKTAAMLYMTMPGNSFIYYGEEVGLKGGSQNDGTFRSRMPWSYTDETGMVTETTPGVPDFESEEYKPEQSVEEQVADKNSLFNFYKQIIDLKNTYPAIARGTISEIVETDIRSVAGYVTEYDGEKLMVIYSLSDDEQTVDISKDSLDYSGIAAQLCVQDSDADGNVPQASLNGTTLTIPAGSLVVLK